jgi:hypothetical protein
LHFYGNSNQRIRKQFIGTVRHLLILVAKLVRFVELDEEFAEVQNVMKNKKEIYLF